MTRQQLINAVKTRMDEISSSDTLSVSVGIEDNKPLDSLIESLLDEAATEILLKAPVHRLTVTKGVTGTAGSGEYQVTLTADTVGTTVQDTGVITIPDSVFARFVSLKMSDWQRSAADTVTPDSPLARRQNIPGMRSGIARPCVVMDKVGGNVRLRYYTTQAATHAISELLFVQRCVAESITDTILISAMVWVCAGKVYGALDNANAVQICNANAQSVLMV